MPNTEAPSWRCPISTVQEFVEAVRFNLLPYCTYNRKFRHRAGGNPDQPFGAPAVK